LVADPALPKPRRRRMPRLVLLAASVLVAALAGELALRAAGGYRLFVPTLQRLADAGDLDAARQLQLASALVQPFLARWQARADLDPGWIATSPPPLPRPPALDKPAVPQMLWLFHYYLLNEALLRAMWVKGQGLPMFPGLELPDSFTVFAPPRGRLQPRFRYPPSRTLPTGLVTNEFGFRGRELPVDKPPGAVRIAFVGASTTVEAARLPHSAPELIEHWLSLWARARGLEVRFETLNAAREAIQSADIRAIVEDELLPLAVDYVVYYEGANQLQPSALQKHVRVQGEYRLADPPPGLVDVQQEATPEQATLLDRLAETFATAQYLRTALRGRAPLAEPPKPQQQVVLPAGFDGPFPLARAGEVLECGAIGSDLDAIHSALAAQRARLVLCTFCWLAEPGLTVDPVLGHNIHVQLNRAYWPFSQATVRALADLQNRFFAAWAAAHGVDLLDVAADLPRDPLLYIDAIHHTELGVRLKAWVLFAGLTRLLERDLAAGVVPVPDRVRDGVHPNLGPGRVVTRADLDAGR
jgi:hypothetical protein